MGADQDYVGKTALSEKLTQIAQRTPKVVTLQSKRVISFILVSGILIIMGGVLGAFLFGQVKIAWPFHPYSGVAIAIGLLVLAWGLAQQNIDFLLHSTFTTKVMAIRVVYWVVKNGI
ncbi:MAG: hypothetical protein HYR94_02590 [Chloroflexi bacterium]|nr:hypothetical protein [Chloroflexota bacterium]